MADKVSRTGKKKRQKIAAMIISVLVVIGLVGSSFIGLFGGGFSDVPDNSDTEVDPEQEIEYLKDRVEELEQYAEDNPESAVTWAEIGNCYYEMGTYAYDLEDAQQVKEYFSNALESYTKAVELEPGKVEYVVDKSTAAFYAGENEIAAEGFSKAIALDPEFSPAYFNYGIFLMNSDNYEQSIAQFEKVMELAAEDSTMYQNAKILKEQLEDYLNDESGNNSDPEED